MRIFILTTLALLNLSSNVTFAFTQSPASPSKMTKEPYVLGERFSLSSKVLDEKRNIYVYKSKSMDAQQHYQVIYLFDAEYLFNATAGIVESLTMTGKIPPTILVGVETTVRVRDYLPQVDGEPQSRQQRFIQSKFPQYGGANKFREFLITELFPLINANYNVVPARTMIGYSNSGVFGLHTLTQAPETFTNYLLISPAGWWGKNEIDEQFAHFKKQSAAFGGNLYLTIAGEGRAMYSNAMRVAANLESLGKTGLTWTLKQHPEDTHQSTIYPSLYQGLPKLYEDLNYTVSDELGRYGDIASVQQHYQSLSQRYGYSVNIPSNVFVDLADKQFASKRNDAALVTLNAFVEAEPNSSYAYSSLAQGYMRTNEYALAKTNFDKAISIVKQTNGVDPSVIDYLSDMASAAEAKM